MKIMKFVLLIAAMCVQTIAFAEDPTPVPLTPGPGGPILGGHGGPHKSPAQPSICPIDVYLNETEGTLDFVLLDNVDAITYYIYDEEGEMLQTEVAVPDDEHLSVSIDTLNAGTYCLQIVVNGNSYSGTFILY